VFQFTQEKLAPKAAEIDKNNEFPELRVSSFLLFFFHGELIKYNNIIFLATSP